MSLTRYFAAPGEGAAFASSRNPEGESNRDPARELSIKVMIVEDRTVVAEGLAALINHQDDMKVVGQAGSIAETFTAAAEARTRRGAARLPVAGRHRR
jgi:hypothetical protein